MLFFFPQSKVVSLVMTCEYDVLSTYLRYQFTVFVFGITFTMLTNYLPTWWFLFFLFFSGNESQFGFWLQCPHHF